MTHLLIAKKSRLIQSTHTGSISSRIMEMIHLLLNNQNTMAILMYIYVFW